MGDGWRAAAGGGRERAEGGDEGRRAQGRGEVPACEGEDRARFEGHAKTLSSGGLPESKKIWE